MLVVQAMADAARLFVITWNPLAGMVERPSGFATTNGRSADLEIVVYLHVVAGAYGHGKPRQATAPSLPSWAGWQALPS